MTSSLVILFAALLPGAAAHMCSNGARVKCTEVKERNDAPSTHADGYSAHGSAHCTPAGEKVYCLFDHDYHHCTGDQLPCCSDGSDPHHVRYRSSNVSDTDFVCTSQEADQAASLNETDQVAEPEEADLAAEPKEADQPAEPKEADPPAVQENGGSKLVEGSLVLKVSLHQQHDTLDACLEILRRDDSAAVRVGLASHLGVTAADVKVLVLKPAGRRLHEDHDGHEFQISFNAIVPEGIATNEVPLAADLEAALGGAGSTLTVLSAHLEWSRPRGETLPAVSDSAWSDCAVGFVAVGAVLVVLFMVVCLCFLKSKVIGENASLDIGHKLNYSVKTSSDSVGATDIKMGKADAEDTEDLESNVPSTQDPCEDEARSIGSAASPPDEAPARA